MGQEELQLAAPLYAAILGVTLFYTAVWWRIFNKARRSGILLAWGLIQAAAWPWLPDPEPWLVLTSVGISFVVSLGIVSTMVSIIGRPGWWVMPVVLGYVPQLAILIWAMQAQAFEELPDALTLFSFASWAVAVLMAIPLYFVGMNDLGDAFGYGTGFRLGLMLAPFVFLPVLALDSNHYGDWGKAERERRLARERAAMTSSVPVNATAAPTLPPTTSLPPLNDASPPRLDDTSIPPAAARSVGHQPQAGWYENPDGTRGCRWWDGERWTDRVDPEARTHGTEPQWDLG